MEPIVTTDIDIPAPPRWRLRAPRGVTIAAYAFLLPTLLLVGLFTLIPIGYALFLSVQKMDIVSGRHSYIGLQNLVYLVEDDKFWAACRNTVKYVVVVVPLQTAIALGLACLLNGKIRFKRAFVTLLFLPTLTSSAAMTMIFMWLFNNNGIVNHFLQDQKVRKRRDGRRCGQQDDAHTGIFALIVCLIVFGRAWLGL